MKNKFYITTTLPYVNAEPHVGHAMEFIRADAIARYKKIQGFDVFINTGTDEHGLKVYRNASLNNIPVQQYVDMHAENFKNLLPLIGFSPEAHFSRTTDKNHIYSAQEFWKRCDKNGYIYKKNYKIKYCVGCELEKTESELVEGKCSIHPSLAIEEIDEENYFFAFSKFQEKLLKMYESNPGFIIPESRFNETKSFVKGGLEDFSISRLKSKMPWGVPVPGDDNHVMYVWFDALVNYISCIGWPDDEDKFKKWWIDTGGVVQYCGKDNNRQQSAMWQAMLMGAGLPNSKQIIINGFITGEGGLKMSKTLGNVVNPIEVINEYGTDALRYFMLREINPFEDSPFTMDKFKEAYNAHLANGLGNLVSRVMKMVVDNGIKIEYKNIDIRLESDYEKYIQSFDLFEINKACDIVWNIVQKADKRIQTEQPFKLIKTEKEKGEKVIKELGIELYKIAILLQPLLPSTSDKIKDIVENTKMPESPLFIRK
jgi:methionyl-tRNA synthetase